MINKDKLSSYSCKGCTNICYLYFDGQVNQYCRTYYDYPGKGLKWIKNYLACLDYTNNPKYTDNNIRLWFPPIYFRKIS